MWIKFQKLCQELRELYKEAGEPMTEACEVLWTLIEQFLYLVELFL
jgi:hypothetical protein